jgi:hypothetical protein
MGTRRNGRLAKLMELRMSGLKFDDFSPGVISSQTHAVIDYIHAGANFFAAAHFSKHGNPRAGYAAAILGLTVLINAMMTDYEYGVFRVWGFKTHGILDYGVAAASAAFPKIFDIDYAPDARFFYAQGGGETLIAGISDYNDDSGATQQWEPMSRRYRERATA